MSTTVSKLVDATVPAATELCEEIAVATSSASERATATANEPTHLVSKAQKGPI